MSGEMIPTSASMRITGTTAEVELVLEALTVAGFRCKSNEKLYPYQDRGKLKQSVYLNDLAFPVPERSDQASGERRSELRSQISKVEALLQSFREELVNEVAQSDGAKPKPWDVVLGGDHSKDVSS